MKAVVKVNWYDLDDILEKYQEILLKDSLTCEEDQLHWQITQEIREICRNSKINSTIIIMENPF